MSFVRLPTIDHLKSKEEEQNQILLNRNPSRLNQTMTKFPQNPEFKVKQLKILLQQSQLDLTKRSKQVAGIQHNFQMVSQLLRNQKLQNAKSREQKFELQEHLDTIKDKLNKKTEIQNNKNKEYEEIFKQKEEYKQRFLQAKKIVQELRDENKRIIVLEQSIKELKAFQEKARNNFKEYSNLKERQKQLQIQIFDKNKEIQDLEAKLSKGLSQNVKLNTKIQQSKMTIQKLQGNVKMEQRRVEQCKKKIKEFVEIQSRLLDLRDKKDKQIVKLNNQITSLHSLLENLRSQITSLQTTNSILSDQIKKHQKKEAKLKEEITSKQNTIKQKIRQIQQAHKFYAHLRLQNQEGLFKIEQLRIQVNQISETLRFHQNSIHLISNDLSKKNSLLIEKKYRIESLQKLVKDLQQKKIEYQGYDQERQEVVKRDDIFSIMKKYSELQESTLKYKNLYQPLVQKIGQMQQEIAVFRSFPKQAIQSHNFYAPLLSTKDDQIRILSRVAFEVGKLNEEMNEEGQVKKKEMKRLQKQLDEYRLRMIEFLKAQKQIEQLKEKQGRYYLMLLQYKDQKDKLLNNLNQIKLQLNKKTQLNTNLTYTLQTLTLSHQQLKRQLFELDAERLTKIKNQQQRKYAMIDQVAKRLAVTQQAMRTKIECGYCRKLQKQPLTVVPCGHTYCKKCSQAYTDSCYTCQNIFPVQRTFSNINYSQLLSKYKIFRQIIEQLQDILAIKMQTQFQNSGLIQKKIYFRKQQQKQSKQSQVRSPIRKTTKTRKISKIK